ncbi:hypothetical protein F0562_013427 [Nyssa sinensis]|uniref:Uncharacterized protein n=1 Tax=Nyssa sinensis TaxID=561372 RepID=A0A5J4ZQ39_9ASTE|nr:hypothetical protein F0562_013427 [Nyssa sinensis]
MRLNERLRAKIEQETERSKKKNEIELAFRFTALKKNEIEPASVPTLPSILRGVSAAKAFYELLSQPCSSVLHPDENKSIAPVELCPILKTLFKILIMRELSSQAILQALRDETMNDPRERIEIAQSHVFYRPSLPGQQH